MRKALGKTVGPPVLKKPAAKTKKVEHAKTKAAKTKAMTNKKLHVKKVKAKGEAQKDPHSSPKPLPKERLAVIICVVGPMWAHVYIYMCVPASRPCVKMRWYLDGFQEAPSQNTWKLYRPPSYKSNAHCNKSWLAYG